MKSDNELICYFLLVAFCVSLAGCGAVTRVESLGDGYEVVAYTHHSLSEPEATQITLQYRKPTGGRIMIWPSLDSGVIVNNDTAIFDGVLGNHQSRLFAVKAPELPLDITSEVLWRWSKQSGGDFEKLLKKASIVYEKEKSNAVEFHFVDGSHIDIIFSLDWNHISDIIREVKEKGVVRKDRIWSTSYIEKEFQPEAQK